jgi:hypothetical protein
MIGEYGNVSLEEKAKEMFEMVSIPNWFSVDSKTGVRHLLRTTYYCFVRLNSSSAVPNGASGLVAVLQRRGVCL